MNILFILASLVASLVEVSLLPLPLLFLLVLSFSFFRLDSAQFLTAFFGGIFLDVFSAGTLGKSSVFLLLLVLFVTLYRRKFQVGSALFIFAVTLLSGLLYLIFIQEMSFDQNIIFPLVVLASVELLVWFFMDREARHETWA